MVSPTIILDWSTNKEERTGRSYLQAERYPGLKGSKKVRWSRNLPTRDQECSLLFLGEPVCLSGLVPYSSTRPSQSFYHLKYCLRLDTRPLPYGPFGDILYSSYTTLKFWHESAAVFSTALLEIVLHIIEYWIIRSMGTEWDCKVSWCVGYEQVSSVFSAFLNYIFSFWHKLCCPGCLELLDPSDPLASVSHSLPCLPFWGKILLNWNKLI